MPNENKKLNFVAKVWDAKANNGVGAYRPIYIAPDATDTIQGDVFLSDEISNKNLNAASGMTAATPKAVNSVREETANKLDKTTTDAQSVASDVTFAGSVTFSKLVTGNSSFKGDLVGNASTASKLQAAKTITLDAGGATSSVSFDGSQNVSMSLSEIDASRVSKGILPLGVIPQAALERLVKVADKTKRLALTEKDVQLGDSVLQLDTNIMYVVVDTSKLNSEDGYQEYKAGSAASAETAAKLTNSHNFSIAGDVTAMGVSFNGTNDVALQSTIANNAVTSAKIKNSSVTSEKVNFNYAGSSSKGGAANSALAANKLSTAHTFSMTGDVQTVREVSFDGTSDVALTTEIAVNAITGNKLADANNNADVLLATGITSSKIENGAITTTKIAKLNVTTDRIADSAVTEEKIKNGAVTTAKIYDSAVTGSKIKDSTISLAKLSNVIGTVACGKEVPAESLDARIRLYGQYNLIVEEDSTETKNVLSSVYIRIPDETTA